MMTREEADILNDLWRFSVSDRYTDKEIRKALDKAIEALKQERPHGEWIPCSERLPEECPQAYLVTIDYGDGLSCVATRFFWDEKRLWNEAEEYITAWMPCPEPYKKEGEQK